MKIRVDGNQLFHEDRRTDITKLIAVFFSQNCERIQERRYITWTTNYGAPY
jgi:hypothetical protein